MTIVKDIRKTVTDTTPVYAVVGVTDLAVERIRDAGTRAAALRLDFDISTIQDKAVKRFEQVSQQAQHIPTQVREQSVEVADKAKETYSGLAVRGEKLVKRIRNQQSTKNLFAQAGNTVTLGKGAVTTVKKAAADTQRAAKSTLTTGRNEVGAAADATLASAEGTVTTVKKSTAAAQRATRSVATSARKTATSASAAAKTATPKVGD